MEKYNKQRLFEVMQRLDPTFKPKLNEDLGFDNKTQGVSPEVQKKVTDLISDIETNYETRNSKTITDALYFDYGLKGQVEYNDLLNFVRQKQIVAKNAAIEDDDYVQAGRNLNAPEDTGVGERPKYNQQGEYTGMYEENSVKPNLNETGEWSGDEDDVAWMDSLRDAIEQISDATHEKLKLIDIRSFDKYQGPYAIVDIEGKRYKVWTTEEQGYLWIEDYPVDNTSGEGTKGGFEGNTSDIIQMLGQKAVTTKDFNYHVNESPEFQEFQQKINNGDVWLDYYAPSDSEEYTDGQTFYNRSGQQLRNPEEYDPNGEGYTPFGDEG